MPVGSPPDLASVTPLTEIWRAGVEIWRVHQASLHPNAFNRTSSPGRFRPFRSGNLIVPTMYGAQSIASALSETVFHDLDPKATEQLVARSQLLGMVRSVLVPTRDLRLVMLHGTGLRRLRTTHADLIESGPSEYAATAAYARALYRFERCDGLIWSSRQHSGARALILFGTRVRSSQLRFNLQHVEPLWKGAGFEEVAAAANDADVTITI